MYLEKPCSHNPKEGELLLAAADKYKNVIQMGNKCRSFPNIVAAIGELHAGVIGRVPLPEGPTETILFIITGIGFGIGALESH